RIDAVVYCADTSNEGHLGHPGRILENVKMLAEAAKNSSKPYYLMSSRPGLMNTQQVQALREAGLVQVSGTRQGLGAIDRVGRANEAELARAFAQLSERIDRIDPRPSDAAFLMQEFVAGGIEVFAGISRDPDFGLSLAFGMGGTAIEVTRDFALRMLPLRED